MRCRPWYERAHANNYWRAKSTRRARPNDSSSAKCQQTCCARCISYRIGLLFAVVCVMLVCCIAEACKTIWERPNIPDVGETRDRYVDNLPNHTPESHLPNHTPHHVLFCVTLCEEAFSDTPISRPLRKNVVV
jgi:hypothetical protein